jgi:hypothetical protein
LGWHLVKGVLEVTTLPSDIALAVATWLSTTWMTSFIQAYRSDWEPEILYAEWTLAPYDGPGSYGYAPAYDHRKRDKPGEFQNGNTKDREVVRPLLDLLQKVEQKHGVIVDHVYAVKNEGRISALWHLPGSEVRQYGTAPVVTVPHPGKTPSKFVNSFDGAEV